MPRWVYNRKLRKYVQEHQFDVPLKIREYDINPGEKIVSERRVAADNSVYYREKTVWKDVEKPEHRVVISRNIELLRAAFKGQQMAQKIESYNSRSVEEPCLVVCTTMGLNVDVKEDHCFEIHQWDSCTRKNCEKCRVMVGMGLGKRGASQKFEVSPNQKGQHAKALFGEIMTTLEHEEECKSPQCPVLRYI